MHVEDMLILDSRCWMFTYVVNLQHLLKKKTNKTKPILAVNNMMLLQGVFAMTSYFCISLC